MTPWTISVATYNLLCDAYIKPEHFADRDPEDLKPEVRHPRLDARVVAFGTDVICTQETDHATFRRLEAKLVPIGYRGRWAHRGGGKPDGCAIFVRAPWKLRATMIFDLDDESRKPTNRVALTAVLVNGPYVCAVANAHFEWFPREAESHLRHGLHQARQMIRQVDEQRCVIFCGDFNVTPPSDILAEFDVRGFADAHPTSAATYVAQGKRVKLDYILHSPDLSPVPRPPAPLDDGTIIPSSIEPSDHLPLIATFTPKA